MQSILHQSVKEKKKQKKTTTLFFAAVLFFFAKRTMVLYNLNMVHLICKAYILNIWGEKKTRKFGTCCHRWWCWGTFAFSLWFHPVFCIYSRFICSELNLKLTCGIGRHYLLRLHTYTHAHTLCSEQSQCKSDQFFSLPPDELWLLNLSTWWPKVIDQYWLNMQGFSLRFFSYGDATLFSAVVCIILFTQPFFVLK